VFQSIFKNVLGNYVYKIKRFKIPDNYRGKGIWYRNEKRKIEKKKKTKKIIIKMGFSNLKKN